MRITLLTLAICVALLPACKSSPPSSQVSGSAKRYPLTGKVISVDPAKKTATIEHEEIEGYMPAMTMEFPIHADWVWKELKPGGEIRAELVVDNTAKEPYFLDNVGIIAAADPENPIDLNTNFAQIGQEVPDFKLTDQDGKRLSIKDYRGKALAITFIYAKCPLPDYCIRMSANFSDLAMKLAGAPELKNKLRLLSISFDPENDTPEKLRSYGIGYMGNDPKAKFDIWQLAVGSDEEVHKITDFFGLRYQRDATDKTQINHSLRTAVISPSGKVTKIFPGNEWTPARLQREMERALTD
jgi:protein SCO1